MAMYSDLNPWAILAAAAAYYALGAFWYSPVGFGKMWMELIGRRADEVGNPAPGLILNGIATLVSALALAVIIRAGGWTNWVDGLGIGALVGIGFVMTVLVNSVAFEGRSPKLFFLNTTYQVMGYCGMGAILGAWP